MAFKAVQQRGQVASHAAGMAVDAVDRVVQPHGEVTVLTVGTGFVEHCIRCSPDDFDVVGLL